MMQRLGNYIRPVDVRNRDLKVKLSQGICNAKYFQNPKQVAENPETHKAVRTGQFAYNRATTRNGEKISIALRQGPDCTVSSAYQVFEVVDENILDPEYLMMWFRRPEFDRLAIFYSHGSAHEFFEWESMCEVQVPVPAIEEQRRIVAEYNTIQKRIATNKKLIETLEQAAQTLYRHTFVDNIDPNNLPEGWRMGTLGEIAEFANGKLTELTPNGEYPVYGGNGIVGKTNSFNGENIIVIGRVGINCGCLYLEPNKCWINDNAIKGIPSGVPIQFLYWHMRNLNLNAQSEGSSQPLITQGILNNQECLLPPSNDIELFAERVETVMRACRLKQQENQTLTQMQTLLLSKMGV